MSARNTHLKRTKKADTQTAELILKEEGQEYATITKMLGNSRVAVQCFDGAQRIAHIRGVMRKKVWMNEGDLVLISLRDYQDDKADIIHRYTPEDARKLKSKGELPDTLDPNDNGEGGEEDMPFDFGEL